MKGMATYTESEKKVAKLEKEKKEREEDQKHDFDWAADVVLGARASDPDTLRTVR